MKVILLSIVFVVCFGALFASACAEGQGGGSAPVGKVINQPVDVIEMPRRFPNVVFTCNGPVGVYVSNDGGVATQVGDPNCAASPSDFASPSPEDGF